MPLKRKDIFLQKTWKIGADNEPKQFYVETNDWLQNKDWICSYDQFNYSKSTLQDEFTPNIIIGG